MTEGTGEGQMHHPRNEIGNEYICQNFIKAWIDNPDLKSSQVIPSLHRALMTGVDSYWQKGLTPQFAGEFRRTEVRLDGTPDNFLVMSFDVIPAMQRYATDLDTLLRNQPVSPEPKEKLRETIHDAAWAYYVFERIHPFLDGNGRIGRMILKRVLKGRNYKDIIFQTNGAYGKGREEHLNAVSAVDKSGNLAHLEVYLLRQLKMRYLNEKNKDEALMTANIEDLMNEKYESIRSQKEKKGIDTIWEGFNSLNLYGVSNFPDHNIEL